MPDKLPVILQVGHFRPQERLPGDLDLGLDSGRVRVEHLADCDELREALVDAETCLVLANGDREGMDELVYVKSRLPTRPVVMVVEPQDTEFLCDALEHGLDSYVLRHEDARKTRKILEVLLRRWVASATVVTAAPHAASDQSPAQAAIRPELESRSFWTFFDAAPIGIKILDSHNVVLYGNREMQRMLGYSEGELRLLTERQLLHPDDQIDGHRSFEALAGGQTDFSTIDVRHMSKTGEEVRTKLGRVAIRDETGRLQFVLETVVDLSGRDRSPQRRRASTFPFLNDLASGIAHDLRNILSLIALDSQVVRDADTDAEGAAQILERIIEAAERGNRIAERISQLGRKNAARVCIEVGNYLHDFRSILQSMIDDTITLEMACNANGATVVAAHPQLDQIVLNLVQNAAEATPAGGTIRLETCRERVEQELSHARPPVAPGDYVVVRVVDRGVGMDEDTASHIFEPYFTRRQDGQGTGLGLANVYRAVHELGGGICVETAPDEGTVFSIFLPSASSDDAC